jgi:hypothetical protein
MVAALYGQAEVVRLLLSTPGVQVNTTDAEVGDAGPYRGLHNYCVEVLGPLTVMLP